MKKIYQPFRRITDGFFQYVLPSELYSFDVFGSEEDCDCWLKKKGYNPEDFVVQEYNENDIEDYRLVDCGCCKQST